MGPVMHATERVVGYLLTHGRLEIPRSLSPRATASALGMTMLCRRSALVAQIAQSHQKYGLLRGQPHAAYFALHGYGDAIGAPQQRIRQDVVRQT